MAFSRLSKQTNLRKSWLDHEYTRYARRDNIADLELALQKLVNVCRRTTDPDVARALADYDHFAKLDAFLSSHPEADSEDT